MHMQHMQFLDWSDEYSVGHEEIDRQHQELFRIVNELYAATRIHQGEKVLGGTIRSLLDYTRTHFAAEEDLMLARKCPDYAAHKAIHNALLAQVTDYDQRYRMGEVAVRGDVLPFLLGWLMDHTMTMDLQHNP